VLAFERQIEPDPRIQDVEVVLPPPIDYDNWPQAGGYPSHAMQHVALGPNPRKIWKTSIGDGSTDRKWLITGPVVADGRVFAIDTDAVVVAIDAANGNKLWQHKIEREDESSAVSFGGGVAYDDGVVFASTGYGVIAALDARTGREIWREFLTVPLRGAPTVTDGQVYVHTYDNQLYALDAATGEILWDHVGIVEVAGILGNASPAVASGTVVAAYSSGELVALTVENGRATWSDTLTRRGAMTPLASLNDIDGHPVIDRGRVYAASHAGRMVAIDLRTGERLWERNIGSLQTPWVAGEFIYLLTVENELVCLGRANGRVRWVRQLQRYKDQEDRKGLLQWAGPVLAGDRLVVTSSHGYALSVSPYTGEILSGMKLSDKAFLAPVVADGVLYILTDDGELLALK
ncbi:MAG: pyrrolo-quinoline quinone, partial [Alphaproteobacteria bacterium]